MNGLDITSQSYENGTVYLRTSGGSITIQLNGELSSNNSGSAYVLHTTSGDIEFNKTYIELTSSANSYTNSVSSVTINALAGNDTITNSGNGNDVIYGFSEGDTLEITSGEISSASVSGSDAILNIGSDKVTIKNADEQELNLLIDGEVLTYSEELIPTEGNDTLTYDTSGITVSALGGNDIISLSSSATGNVLSGDADNDKIYTNGSGNVISYTSGRDFIYGFGGKDVIQIADGISSSVQSGDDVIIYVDGTSNTITVKDKQLAELLNRNGEIVINPYPMSLTSGADNKSFSDNGATVYALGGNDTIISSGEIRNSVQSGAKRSSAARATSLISEIRSLTNLRLKTM